MLPMHNDVAAALRIAKEAPGVSSQFGHLAQPKQPEPFPSAPEQLGKIHTGPIHSAVAGRTDHLPVEVHRAPTSSLPMLSLAWEKATL